HARFRCDTLSQARLPSQELDQYRAIALLDPEPLPAEAWNKLAAFCERGGGLAIFLGRHAKPTAFPDAAAMKVMGGKLSRVARTPGDVYVAPRSYDHPILAVFRQ